MKKYIIAAIAASLLETSASAAVTTFDFVARVDQLDTFLPSGTLITGNFSYDTSIIPTIIYQHTNGVTAGYRDPSIKFTINFAGDNFTGISEAFVGDYTGIKNNDDGDGFTIGKYLGNIRYSMYIWEMSDSWLKNANLPSSYPSSLWQGPFVDPNDDDDITVPHGELNFDDYAKSRSFTALVLSITPATASAIPESRTWAMLLVGFGAIGTIFRRRWKVNTAVNFG